MRGLIEVSRFLVSRVLFTVMRIDLRLVEWSDKTAIAIDDRSGRSAEKFSLCGRAPVHSIVPYGVRASCWYA